MRSFLSNLSSSSLTSSTSLRSEASGSSQHGGKRQAPATEMELAALMAQMRAALSDEALTNEQLLSSKEEGVTPAQLKR
jgi:hypothetical protein